MITDCLAALEQVTATREEFMELCLLLTSENALTDHPQFSGWSPAKGRMQARKVVRECPNGQLDSGVDAE